MASPRFRNLYTKLAPRWLTEGEGGLVLFGIGAMLDAGIERLRLGIRAKYPSHAPPDALALIGRDRRIVRGFDETDEHYATRLLRWLDDWRIAGNPFALMGQLRAYLGVDLRIRTVDTRGNWFTLEEDGTKSFLLKQGNWDWAGDPATMWSQFWVILYPPASLWTQGPTIGDLALWGGAIGTPGYTIGSTATPEQVASVKSIVRTWKPAGTRCVRIIVAFDDADFAPADAKPPNPDGDWNIASNRIANAAYWNPNG